MNYLLFEILVCFLYPLPILSCKSSLIIFRMTLVLTQTDKDNLREDDTRISTVD